LLARVAKSQMRNFIFTLIFLVFYQSSTAQVPGYPFSTYYPSQVYQGGIQNFAISQNEWGLIYVANNFGMLEYDGSSWRRYSLQNSTKVRDVLVVDTQTILASGQGEFGYFQAGYNGRLEYHSLLGQLPDSLQNLDEVWKIYKLHDHVIFCTLEVLLIFDHQLNFTTVIKKEGGDFESFHFQNNQLIINHQEAGLLIFENGSLSPLEMARDFRENIVTGILGLSNNRKLIFTRDEGIFLHTSSGYQTWNSDLAQIPLQINKAIRLKSGDIVIGTQRHGLFLINETGNIRMHLDKTSGLENDTVLSLFEDLSGNLWVGHNNGITLLELSLPFHRIDRSVGLNGTGYSAIFFEDKLYYGTNNGLSHQRLSQNEFEPLKEVPNSTGQVYQVLNIQDLLLAAHNDGAIQIKEPAAEKIEGQAGVWNFIPLKDHPNYIISGLYAGLALFEIDGNQVKFVRKIKGFNESCRILQQDKDGIIWMTHGYKGVYRLELNDSLDEVNATFYGLESGLPTQLLISVWKINNRLLFTTEYGIYSYNSQLDRFEKDSFFAPYFDNDLLITSIVEDPLGNIFYIGNKEVGVLEKKINGEYQKNTAIFNKIIPYLNDDLQNISLLGANEVLFAAKDGFIWYKLGNNSLPTYSYPTIIRSAFLTGITDSLVNLSSSTYTSPGSNNPFEVAYNQANFRFEYTNAIPNQENNTLFQVWLEGLDEGYGEWTSSRVKEYTNLREGNYQFHVRSKNIYGQLGDEDIYSFVVTPPWYRSQLAFFAYILLGLASGVLGYLWIEKSYRKKTARFKAVQQKALAQKETALRSSHEEIEKLKFEKLQVEVNGKNKELASATMHLINKNSFIDHVKLHLNSIIKKSKNNEVKQELQKVVVSIDRNIADDKEWEQFEIHFDQVHGDFIQRFKKSHQTLSPQEIKLSAYLRMNLSSKEIATLMNISTRGVEIARYRLRKKLEMERSDNLQEYILKF
jgi:ligand-binding sensor domain-containing protein/DNA-binding CsgD family transcriptional regulator